MVRMTQVVAIVVAVVLTFSTAPAMAASNPQFDATGVWKNPSGELVQLFQEKDEVNGVYVNTGFAHRISGRYVSPTKIKLIQLRRTRANGCEMVMMLDMTVQTANAIVSVYRPRL